VAWAALWALLFIGIAWRFVGVLWDAGNHLHPDERFLTMVTPELGLPSSLADWFHTAQSPFNPFRLESTGLFVYGQLPLLLAKLAALPFKADSYDGILIVGRVMSALADAGTVIVTLLIGRRLLGPRGGMLAAILLAFTALNIQQAHFFVTDTFAAFFTTLAFWGLLKWLDHGPSGREKWALFTGAAWGLAAACKISAGLFAPIVLLALVLEGARIRHQRADATSEKAAADWGAIFWGALAIGLGAFVCFRIGHPMAFRGEAGGPWLGISDVRPETLEAKNFWASLEEQRQITVGARDVPWNIQWAGRADIWWPLRNLLVWGIGWQALLPALAALLWVPLRVLKKHENAQWILVAAWAAWSFGYHAMQFSKFSRYFLFSTPFFALLAAWAARELWRRALLASQNAPRARSKYLLVGATAAIAAMLSGTVFWGSAVASIYRVPNTRVRADEWMQSLPAGARIAGESVWDDALPLHGKEKFEMLDLKLLEAEDSVAGIAKREHLLSTLDRAEYIAISSPRLWASLPRMPRRFPLATRYYRALFSGELGWAPVGEWAAYPQLNLLGWKIDFEDDNAEEGLSVYDHPRVVLFRKGAAWSREHAASILSEDLVRRADPTPLSELKKIPGALRVDEGALPWLPHARANAQSR
jgi:hypothetical protein